MFWDEIPNRVGGSQARAGSMEAGSLEHESRGEAVTFLLPRRCQRPSVAADRSTGRAGQNRISPLSGEHTLILGQANRQLKRSRNQGRASSRPSGEVIASATSVAFRAAADSILLGTPGDNSPRQLTELTGNQGREALRPDGKRSRDVRSARDG